MKASLVVGRNVYPIYPKGYTLALDRHRNDTLLTRASCESDIAYKRLQSDTMCLGNFQKGTLS